MDGTLPTTKDLNTIVAWDSNYPGVREALAVLDA